MAVIKCEKGHYYDNEKYGACPHCENGLERIDSQNFFDDIGDAVTIAGTEYISGSRADDDTTVMLTFDDYGDDDKTVAKYSAEAGNKLVVGWLVCTKGIGKGRDYRLYHGWNRIGRGMNMDIYLPDDKKVSSNNQIAVVFDDRKSEFHIVNQLGSLTYLNGKNVTEAQILNTGDVITMGDTELVFIAFCTEGRKW